MSISIVIQGTTYNIPEQGQSPPWGEDLSNILQAITTSLNSVVGPSDVLTTNFTIANNQSSVANVTGLAFDVSTVRSAIISYSLYRSSAAPSEFSECGQIMITYKSVANSWELTQFLTGSSGVVFTITNAGQVQYTSTNLSGGSYVGKMKFSARSFLQT